MAQFVLSGRACYRNVNSVLHAEMLSLWFALEICFKEQMKVAYVKSDSLLAISEIAKANLLLQNGLVLF